MTKREIDFGSLFSGINDIKKNLEENIKNLPPEAQSKVNKKQLEHEESLKNMTSLFDNLRDVKTVKTTPEAPQNVKINTEIDPTYRMMYNSPATNELTSTLSPLNLLNDRKDPITGLVKLKIGKYEIELKNIDDLETGLRVNTHKLMDALAIKFTEQNHYKESNPDHINKRVSIHLEELAILQGKSTKPSALKDLRRDVGRDIRLLLSTSIEATTESSNIKGEKDFAIMTILTYGSIKNNVLTVTFGDEFASYLNNKYLMNYHTGLLKLDTRNRLSFIIGRKLGTHYNMLNNRKKQTHNIIKMESLISLIGQELPSYEDVMEKYNRNVQQRIIDPIEKALNILQDEEIISWNYCKAKHQPISDEELEDSDYSKYIQRYIEFELVDFPDNSSWLEAKRKEAKNQKNRVEREKAKLIAEQQLNNEE